MTECVCIALQELHSSVQRHASHDDTLDNQSMEIDSLHNMHRNALANLSAKSAENASLRMENTTLQAQETTWRTTEAALLAALSASRVDNHVLHVNHTALHAHIVALHADNIAMHSDNTTLRAETTSLHSELASVSMVSSLMAAQLAALQDELQGMRLSVEVGLSSTTQNLMRENKKTPSNLLCFNNINQVTWFPFPCAQLTVCMCDTMLSCRQNLVCFCLLRLRLMFQKVKYTHECRRAVLKAVGLLPQNRVCRFAELSSVCSMQQLATCSFHVCFF